MKKVKKINDLSFLNHSNEILRIGNQAVKAAKAENRRLGLPEIHWIGGKIYFEYPDGEVTTKRRD